MGSIPNDLMEKSCVCSCWEETHHTIRYLSIELCALVENRLLIGFHHKLRLEPSRVGRVEPDVPLF
jgi:hypothetical protein